jgi:methanogenic corrinoid protein MtbC1
VKSSRFVEEQQKVNADAVALSALMTTSMVAIPNVVKALKSLDPGVTVMAGGAPMTREAAMQFGADGFAANCSAVVKETLEALQRTRSAQSAVR